MDIEEDEEWMIFNYRLLFFIYILPNPNNNQQLTITMRNLWIKY